MAQQLVLVPWRQLVALLQVADTSRQKWPCPRTLRNRLNSQIPSSIAAASIMLQYCVAAIGGGELMRPCLMGIHTPLPNAFHVVWSRIRFSVCLEGSLKGGISFSDQHCKIA